MLYLLIISIVQKWGFIYVFINIHISLELQNFKLKYGSYWENFIPLGVRFQISKNLEFCFKFLYFIFLFLVKSSVFKHTERWFWEVFAILPLWFCKQFLISSLLNFMNFSLESFVLVNSKILHFILMIFLIIIKVWKVSELQVLGLWKYSCYFL